MLTSLKQTVLVHAINALFSLLARIKSERVFRWSYSLIVLIAEKLVKKDYYVEKIRWIKEIFDSDHPSLSVTKKILRGTNPHHRKMIIKTFVINQLLVGTNRRKHFSETDDGFYPPGFFVISPSMKCNLNCYGCYAGSYEKDAELTFEEIDRVLNQAKEMGVFFCVVSGGEPLFHPRIFDIFEKHNDVIFHIYTNGSLIDRETCQKLARVGNVIPAISIEGYREETDNRRGAGHFEKVMQAMDLLREAKVLFGFSATLTRRNAESLSSDEFIDFMIEKGMPCASGSVMQLRMVLMQSSPLMLISSTIPPRYRNSFGPTGKIICRLSLGTGCTLKTKSQGFVTVRTRSGHIYSPG